MTSVIFPILAEQLCGNRGLGPSVARSDKGELSVLDAAITRWSCHPYPSEADVEHGPVGARSYCQLG